MNRVLVNGLVVRYTYGENGKGVYYPEQKDVVRMEYTDKVNADIMEDRAKYAWSLRFKEMIEKEYKRTNVHIVEMTWRVNHIHKYGPIWTSSTAVRA